MEKRYSLSSHILRSVDHHSYLGDELQNDLKWSHHITKATKNCAHEYCTNPRRLSVLTEYVSLSLTHFTPINLANHFIQIIGPIPFQKETCFNNFIQIYNYTFLDVPSQGSNDWFNHGRDPVTSCFNNNTAKCTCKSG